MEFTEIFTGVAIALVMIVSIFGLTNYWNNSYGSTLGQDGEFNATVTRVHTLLEGSFVNDSLTYAESTQPQAGAGNEPQQQDNMIKRALNTIGLIDDLIGLIPALIKDGATALNIDAIYWQIAEALFWIIFSITLAYLLLLGARTLI